MTQASQRHKLETRDMADSAIELATLTFTFRGQFSAGLLITATVNGDSTGDLVSQTRLANAMTATEAAAAVATVLHAITGVNAVAAVGVITISFQAPNASVSTVNAVLAAD